MSDDYDDYSNAEEECFEEDEIEGYEHQGETKEVRPFHWVWTSLKYFGRSERWKDGGIACSKRTRWQTRSMMTDQTL